MRFDVWRPTIVTARVLEEGGRLPWGYGVAWCLPYSHAYYCLPMPFNRIVGAFRAWYFVWCRPYEHDPFMQIWRDGHSEGWRNGNQDGYERGLAHRLMVEEIRAELADVRREIAESEPQ